MTQPTQPTPLLNNIPAKQYRETLNQNFYDLFNNLQTQLQRHQDLCTEVQEIKSTTVTKNEHSKETNKINELNEKIKSLDTVFIIKSELTEIFSLYNTKINNLQEQINNTNIINTELQSQLEDLKPWYKKILGRL